MEKPKHICSRESLIERIWGAKDVSARTVDVHINRLRKALHLGATDTYIIETIRSVGYCLRRDIG
jgi:two-component system phosphate regulon response regulator PhoB